MVYLLSCVCHSGNFVELCVRIGREVEKMDISEMFLFLINIKVEEISACV